MSLQNRFRIMTDFFVRESIDYALVGAFALAAYGYSRATSDVDFLTRYEHQARIIAYLESLGFETLHQSAGYSNHLLALEHARFDFVYVDAQTATTIFSAIRQLPVLGDLELPVVSPEHLVMMKLFAVRNDPPRKFKELGDIREILLRQRMDLDSLRSHFQRAGLIEAFEEIRREITAHD